MGICIRLTLSLFLLASMFHGVSLAESTPSDKRMQTLKTWGQVPQQDMALQLERVVKASELAFHAKTSAERAADDAGKRLSDILTIAAILISFFGIIAAVLSTFLLRANTIFKKANIVVEEALEIQKKYQEGVDILHATRDSLRADVSITDKSEEELRTAAELSAPFSHAMLASYEKDWHAASFLWRQVLRAIPDNDEATFQLAYALQEKVKNKEPEIKKKLLLEATDLYKSIEKKSACIWSNWGVCLYALSKMEPDKEKRKELLNKAVSKCQMAIEVDEQYAVAWSNWGDLLLDRSSLAATGDKKAMLDEAISKFEKAMEIDPNNSFGWVNWGVSLGALAEIEPDSGKKLLLLKEALDCCQNAEEGSSLPVSAYLELAMGNEAASKANLERAVELDSLNSVESITSSNLLSEFKDKFIELLEKTKEDKPD